MLNGMDDLKLRATTLNDLVHEAAIYTSSLQYEDKALNAIQSGKDALKALYEVFNKMEDFSPENVQKTVQNIVDESFDGKYGKVGMPLRAALTGRGQSPSVPNIVSTLGRDETCKRIQQSIDL